MPRNEERRAHDSPFRVEAASLLEDLCYDWYGAVDWVADNADEGFGAVLGDCGCEVRDDACVDLGNGVNVAGMEMSEGSCEVHTVNKEEYPP